MIRAVLAVVAAVVSYFGLCFLVGAIAGARAGMAYPNSDAGARASARAVEDNRPYVIGGALMLGILTGGFVPLGRKSKALAVPTADGDPAALPLPPAPQSDDPWAVPDGAIYKAPSPLRHLVMPVLLLVPLGMVALFWYYVISGYRTLQKTNGGGAGLPNAGMVNFQEVQRQLQQQAPIVPKGPNPPQIPALPAR